MKNILVLLITILMVHTKVWSSVDWPFLFGDVQATVSGSVGEYRYTFSTSTHRFHEGLDLINGGYLDVYAIQDGIVTWHITGSGSSTKMEVGDDTYYHVVPTQDIINGGRVEVLAGQLIGTMATDIASPHVHLERNGVNFLNHLLFPYEDNSAPTFVKTHLTEGFAFYQNRLTAGSTNYQATEYDDRFTIAGEEYLVLYNKIDIAAHIVDQRTGPNGDGQGHQLAPYGIDWRLKQPRDNSTVVENSYQFSDIPNNTGAIDNFHPLSSHPGSPSIHIVTASSHTAPFDRYWNTGLKERVDPSWSASTDLDYNANDAISNLHVAIQDGIYQFEIEGYDVDYDNNPNLSTGVETEKIIIDNFRPFVEKVEIRAYDGFNNRLVYTGQWNKLTSQLTLDQQEENAYIPGDLLYVEVTFSEPMTKTVETQPSIKFGNNPSVYYSGQTSNDLKTYNWSLSTDIFTDSDKGQQHTLEIRGEDIAGNQLIPLADQTVLNASNLARRNQNGTWSVSYSNQSADTRHFIFVDNTTCPDGGRVTGDCPLIADFTHAANGPNYQTVTFFDLSSPEEVITGWAWDFGDGLTSIEQYPVHTYALPGEYTVILTAFKGADESASFEQNIIVEENQDTGDLVANFTMSPETGITASEEVYIVSYSSTGNILKRTWEIFPEDGYELKSGETLNSPDIHVTFKNQGTYLITLTIEDAINTDEITKEVEVSPKTGDFTVDFEWDAPLTAGQFEEFRSLVSGSTCLITDYKWTFTIASNPWFVHTTYGWKTKHTFLYPGTYVVELTATNNCGKAVSASKSVTVVPAGNIATARFSGGDGIVRSGQTIRFLDKSTPKEDIVQWIWKFELPEDLEGVAVCPGWCPDELYYLHRPYVEHTYNEPGSYKVRLDVTSDKVWAGSIMDKTIHVVPDWALPAPIQTETQIIQLNTRFIDTYPAWSISMNGDLMAANTAKWVWGFPPFIGNDTIWLFKHDGAKWNKFADFRSKNGETYGKIALNDQMLLATSGHGLHYFQKNGAEWDPINTPSLEIMGDYSGFRVLNIDAGDHAFIYMVSINNSEYKLMYNGFINPPTYAMTGPPKEIAVDENTIALLHGDQINVLEHQNGQLNSVAILRLAEPLVGADLTGIDIDDDVIVVGTSYSHDAVYVFEKPTTGWQNMTETAKLTPYDGQELGEVHAGFGLKVRIDGNKIGVLANGDKYGAGCHPEYQELDQSPCMRGGMYVFEKGPLGWQSTHQVIKLITERLDWRNNTLISWHEDIFDLEDNRLVISNHIEQNFNNFGLLESSGIYHSFDLPDSYIPESCISLYQDDNFYFHISNNTAYEKRYGRIEFGGSGVIMQPNDYEQHLATFTDTDGPGGYVKFRATEIVLKNGFAAEEGADVTLSAMTCAEMIIEDN